MNFTYANFARIDADAVSALVNNGEWDRALSRARLLVSSIEHTMAELGIEPTLVTIHDFTPSA
jgi:hypothetical protein